MKQIYLDYAAATPLDPTVLVAMQPYLEAEFANPSSIYAAARRTREAVDEARRTVAGVLGAKVTEVVFTASGSESINLAIQGVLRAHPHSNWITTAIEHEAVLAERDPLQQMGFGCQTVPVRSSGVVDAATLLRAVSDETVLVTVQLANNELGTIQPVAQIARGIAELRRDRATRGVQRPLYLHTDAVAAANYLDLSVARLGVDLLSLSGSKIYGPKGSGLLYVRTGVRLEGLIWGGGQERGRRSGTENVAGVVGFARALELTSQLRPGESHRLTPLRDSLVETLREQIPEATLNGDAKRRLPGTVNLTIPGVEGHTLILYLDKAGIMASTGSACASADLDPSHVLVAIGRDAAQAKSSLRITLGRQTTPVDLAHLVRVLPGIVKRLRLLQ